MLADIRKLHRLSVRAEGARVSCWPFATQTDAAPMSAKRWTPDWLCSLWVLSFVTWANMLSS